MKVEQLKPLRGKLEEPWRQTHGIAQSEKSLCVLGRPRDAEVMDGEASLRMANETIGLGWWELSLQGEAPAALINGFDLLDPAIAVVVSWNGFVLLVRSGGQVDIEKIPSVGDEFETDEEGAYGIVGGASIQEGRLFVACTEGRVFSRTNPGVWRHLNPGVSTALDIPPEDEIQLDAVAAKNGRIVAVGKRDMQGTIFEQDTEGHWSRTDLGVKGLRDVCFDEMGVPWACGRGGVILRKDESGWVVFRNGTPDETFTSLATSNGKMFVSQALGGVFEIGVDAIEPLTPIPALLTSPTITSYHDGLLAQGENGFGVFDGETWTRIQVPW